MAAPTISGIDISSGPPGTLVVITGSNFNETVWAVGFGGYATENYSVVSETEIAAFIPAGSGTNVNLGIANSDGVGTLAAAWTWDPYEGPPGGGGGGSAPTVTSINPTESAYENGQGGDAVTVNGNGFTTARNVFFGEIPVDFTLDAATPATKLVAVAPPMGDITDYTVEVDVENIYGRSADPGTGNDFKYLTFDVPVITSIAPTTGIARQRVVITGDYFTPVNKVSFGAYEAVFNVLSDESIEAWAPYGPTGTVNVVVSGPSGDSPEPGTPSANDFAYIGTVTGLTVTPMANAVLIKWDPVSYIGAVPVSYRVYVGTTSDPDTVIATTSQTSIVYPIDHDDGLRYYAVSWVDDNGNETAKCTAVSATSLQATADVISDGAINAMSMFAAGIAPPQVVAALPDLSDPEIEADYPDGALVFLTTEEKLYRKVAAGPNTNTATGKATWNDRSTSNNDGTLTNFGWTTSSGWAGTGSLGDIQNLTFDGGAGGAGTNDYVALAAAIAPATARVFSVETWVAPLVQNGVIFISSTSGSLNNFYMLTVTSDGQPQCAYRANAGSIYTCTGNKIAGDGAWHHFVATWSSTGPTMKLYLDGVLQESKTVDTNTVSINASVIGWNTLSTPPATCYYGSIAALRAYDDTLDQADVTAHYKLGPFGVGYQATNLKLDLSAQAATTGSAWVAAITGASLDSIISADQIIGNSITAGKIAAGAIGATEVAADAIMSRSIFVGSFDNLIPNANSEQSTTGRDTSEASIDYEFRGVTTVNEYAGSQCRRLLGVASGTTTMAITRKIPVNPNEQYYCECRARLGSAVGHGHLKLACYKSDGTTEVSTSPASTDEVTVAAWPTNPIKVKDGSANNWYTIPDGGGTAANAGVYIQVYLETTDIGAANYLYVDEMFLRRMNEGSLIVDGTITGTHIEAAVSLSAPVITGGTITGTTVNVTGTLLMGTSGVIKTASSGKRLEITNARYDALLFYSGVSEEEDPAELTVWGVEGSPDSSTVQLQSCDLGYGFGYVSLGASSTSTTAQVFANDVTVGSANVNIHCDTADATVYVEGKLVPYDDWSSGTSSDGIWIQDMNTAANRLKLYFDSGSTPKRLFCRLDGDTYTYFEGTSSGW